MSVPEEPFVEHTADTGPESQQGEGAEEAVFKVAPEASEGASEQAAQAPQGEPGPDLAGVAGAEPVPSPPEPPPASQPPSPAPKGHRRPSLFWPLVLIGAGVMLLLSNLGYVPWSSWNVLWRLWPVLLIALGVDVLFGRRSMAGALLSGVLMIALFGGVIALIVFAQNIPMLAEWSEPAEWQVEHIAHPLNGIKQATVDIEWTSVPGYLYALEDSNDLIEGDVAYTGELLFDVRGHGSRVDVTLDHQPFPGVWLVPFRTGSRQAGRWDVGLSPDVVFDLSLDAGSGGCDFDLSDLQIESLYLDVGSGQVDLALPPDSSFKADIGGGSGQLTIALPRQVCARIVLDAGSGAFRPDDRFRLLSGERDDDGVWETENCGSADYRIEFQIGQGSGRIVIE
jgi:hypothetical protein